MISMKHFFKAVIFFLIGVSALFVSGCEKCDPNIGVKVGEQFFTITYLDQAGGNYLTNGAWDLSLVEVQVDTSGGKAPGAFVPLPQTFTDGKLGPFSYTSNFIQPIDKKPNLNRLLSKTYKYDYHIRKGSINNTEVIRVEFRLTADDCNLKWSSLKFYKKVGVTQFEEITEFSGNEKAEIVFIQ